MYIYVNKAHNVELPLKLYGVIHNLVDYTT